jgi:hypothetical protein
MNAATRARTATNGAARARVGSFAAAGGMPYDDPMSKVLGLDAKTSSLAAWLGFGSGGTLLFVGLTALVLVVAWWHTVQLHRATSKIEEIEILREETPPPPPPPTAEPKPEAPAARAVSHEPPPPPAQAAKVMTQEPKPDEPVDLTGNTFVQGNADTYAGGFTTATGTGTAAARTAPGASSTPGGNGPPTGAPPPPPPGPDRSRTASLGGGSEWSCPFPQEADTAQIDEAYVTLQVDVKADGSPATVKVLGDPGNGFGREARRCALGKRYSTALDHDGTAIPGTTKPFRVHFSR